MIDLRYRNPGWVAEQLREDNRDLTMWSARFEFNDDKFVAMALQDFGAAKGHPRVDGAPHQIVVEFNPLLVSQVAQIAVKHGGILCIRARRC